MASSANPILLDTHIWIWLMEGAAHEMSASCVSALEHGAASRALYVSAISVWEVGMLARKGRLRLRMDVTQWVANALKAPGIVSVPLDHHTALASSRLPDEPHGDPADRLLIAAAHLWGWTLATRDERILQYAERFGHIQVLDCHPERSARP